MYQARGTETFVAQSSTGYRYAMVVTLSQKAAVQFEQRLPFRQMKRARVTKR